MEKTRWPAICGLVLGTFLLSREIPTSFAFDKPLLSSVVFLSSLGAVLTFLGKFILTGNERSAQGKRNDTLPLNDVGAPHPSRETSPSPEDVTYGASPRELRLVFLLLVGALCLRVQLLLRVLGNLQCAFSTFEPLVPFVFACWEYWSVEQHTRPRALSDPTASAYAALEHYVTRAPYRYVAAIGLVSFGEILAVAVIRSPASTYVCATSFSLPGLTPVFQFFGVMLDAVIVHCVAHLLHSDDSKGARNSGSRFVSVGRAFLYAAQVSVAILSVMTIVYYAAFTKSAERRRFFKIPNLYIWSLWKLDVLFCFTAICALLMTLHLNLTTVTIIPTFVSTCTTTTIYFWNNRLAFPRLESNFGYFAISLALFGVAAYFHCDANSNERVKSLVSPLFRKVPSWFYGVLLVIFFVHSTLWTTQSDTVSYHPVELLMYEAQARHEIYANQTSTSRSLAEAVSAYQERYHRHPPPGFQHWYDYATIRNSVIVDDFDSIYRDLLPFHDLTPAELRERTWEMASNPWHDVSGLSIRNGVLKIAPNVNPMHRWMLDGVARMIRPFAEWLPDMDLAFNMNDEPRVAAVPFEAIGKLSEMDQDDSQTSRKPENTFSEGRANQWLPISEEPVQTRLMTELSRQRTFYDFGNFACRPGSPARVKRLWDVQRFCTSCIEAHSIGAFLANWTLAADICHQPDLSNLHGFYISPASFKGTHELYPIFSQSKAHGFNDILYPSAWNYIGKAKYEPSDEYPDVPYANKNHTIFWRGATTEGISHDFGHWKGMARQRFLRLTKTPTGPSSPQSILVPSNPSGSRASFSYLPIPLSQLTSQIPTDIHIVHEIGRCNGIDCPQQKYDLGPLVERTDFQSHWQYKYLLDLDGAGFSGRFLPFLKSHSLPFKAALFREWWDDRVTAWLHFVPLDLRGHGFWATVAYFAGFEGKVGGGSIRVEANERDGERIAESGREWAQKVLRKEDMEIYLFRLLLEWGRLTDDRRDEIGFSVDAG